MAAGKTAKGAGLDCACTHKGVAAPHRWNVGGCLLIWTERLERFSEVFYAGLNSASRVGATNFRF